MSVDDQIEQQIDDTKPGSILFMEDFSHLGSAGAVHIALHRKVKSGSIKRLARGIYAKPKFSKILEHEIFPTAEEVALAIARRDKARVIPTGSFALNSLGLSTQVPLNIVYLTDGSPRKITIGNSTITFKKTTPRILALKGVISSLVVQALKEIGKGNVRESELVRILELLKKEDYSILKHDISLAPRWIAEIMAKSLIK